MAASGRGLWPLSPDLDTRSPAAFQLGLSPGGGGREADDSSFTEASPHAVGYCIRRTFCLRGRGWGALLATPRPWALQLRFPYRPVSLVNMFTGHRIQEIQADAPEETRLPLLRAPAPSVSPTADLGCPMCPGPPEGAGATLAALSPGGERACRRCPWTRGFAHTATTGKFLEAELLHQKGCAFEN